MTGRGEPDRSAGHSREQALIHKAFAPLTTSQPGAAGLLDDAAALSIPAGMDLVVTKDLVVAGVHFLPDDPPEMIARKALRVNLSDLAAKGATPGAYFLGLALPAEVGEDWVLRFAQGLALDQAEFGCGLAGGDMTRTGGALTVSVTATGLVPEGGIVRRNTARPGDLLFVTGTIGDAVLGLAVLKGTISEPAEDLQALVERYRLPLPRVAAAKAVRDHAAAAMDVSDGLAGDLELMCAGSGVGARVIADDVPLSAPARAACAADPGLFERLVCGGDDYEILCAVPPEKAEAFRADIGRTGVAVAQIGAFSEDAGDVEFVDKGGTLLDIAIGSYSHF